MSGPIFLAQTPRAGKWNHCCLAGQSVAASAKQVDEFAGAVVAKQNETSNQAIVYGDNYMGLACRQTQLNTGREGFEVLVLAGVPVNKLARETKQRLGETLHRRLLDLGHLVENLDWEAYHSQPGLVQCPELSSWLEADFPQGLPGAVADRPIGAAKALVVAAVRERNENNDQPSSSDTVSSWAAPRRLHRALLMAVLALGVLVVSAVAMGWKSNFHSGVLPRPAAPDHDNAQRQTQPAQSPKKGYEPLYLQLVEKLKQNGLIENEKELQEGLRHAGILPVPAVAVVTPLEVAQLMKEPSIRKFLDEYASGKRSADGFLFLLADECKELKKLHAARATKRVDVRATRKQLMSFQNDFEDFKRNLKDLQVHLEHNTEPEFFKLMAALTVNDPKFGPVDFNKEQTGLSWFTKEDAEACMVLCNVLDRVKATNEHQCLPQEDEIDAERKRVLGRPMPNETTGKLYRRYEALVGFINNLRQFEFGAVERNGIDEK